ncbi:cytochrome c maturation protein CcmE [Mucilaginibacter calamicampi]|uniref:Cytochrome c maturation protein CcmE n=1 Tax=Mucilaginibacter calamicampi TaxID=1302352 RepID=A0ABW2YUH7_9SPHI
MKKSSILGLVVIAIAIGVVISLYGSASTYGSFADARETSSELHVVGKLNLQKELHYEPVKDANYFSFYIIDEKGEECKVEFSGAKPQDFERSEQVVMVGKMEGNKFHASHITLKCPSKYTNDKVEFTEFKAKQANI